MFHDGNGKSKISGNTVIKAKIDFQNDENWRKNDFAFKLNYVFVLWLFVCPL